jgi:hypothetical protein
MSGDARTEGTNMSKNKPAHEIRLGRIRGTVWRNETEGGTFHNVAFSRLYKDDSGDWQDSATFSRDDLPLVAKVADLVHSWLYEHGNGERKEAARG